MENILIATIGLEYKVLLSALKSFVIDKTVKINKVYIITTNKGKEVFVNNLLKNGALEKFKKEYKLDFDFDNKCLIVPKNKKGKPIETILTEDDNKLFLKECFEITKKYLNKNSRISFLITGGMKGMSSCLSLSAQLFGREQDTIYTLSPSGKLPKDKIKSLPKYLQDIVSKDKEEHFSLIKMPYVKLSSNLNLATILNLPVNELVNNTNDYKKQKVIINIPDQTISIGDISCRLQSSLFAFYLYFVYKKIKFNCKNKECENCFDCYLNRSESLNDFCKNASKTYDKISNKKYNLSTTGIKDISKENFNSYKSKIKKKFLEHFEFSTVNQICISSVSKGKDTKCGISLSKNLFEILEG
ncbi:MAG: CRISPR-associated ring nuclease [Bdellovibrionota bacterium]